MAVLSSCQPPYWPDVDKEQCIEFKAYTKDSYPQYNYYICKTPRSCRGKQGVPCVKCRQAVHYELFLINTNRNLNGFKQGIVTELWTWRLRTSLLNLQAFASQLPH